MSWPYHAPKIYIVIFMVWIPVSFTSVTEDYVCPIGFELSYPKTAGRPLCYRLKGPESFDDTFKDCNGNLYNSEFYQNYDFVKSSIELWTEYKTVYPGGLFYKWTVYSSPSEELEKEIIYSPSLGIDEELCIVIDANQRYTAKRCSEKRYRYCVVETLISDADDASYCGENYVKFWSPRPTCLARFKHRVNFNRAQDLCRKNGGTILHRGWRYATSPLIHELGSNWTDPLGIVLTPKDTLLWNVTEDGRNEVPDSEFNFRDGRHSRDTSVVALHIDSWLQVKDSFNFQSVTCEKPIQLKALDMNLTVNEQGKIFLLLNDTTDDDDIKCFTDSFMYKPIRVKMERIDNKTFELKPEDDGYYWCKIIESKEYRLTESKKALRITEYKMANVYAIKVRLNSSYEFSKASKVDLGKLKKYIYSKQDGNFKETFDGDSDENWKKHDVFSNKKIKRVYLDSKTLLIHVKLNIGIKPVPPGTLEDMQLMLMKPVYFCNSVGSIPKLVLGQTMDLTDCRSYRCVGDFNEGVQLVETATESCTTSKAPVTVYSSINFTPTVINPNSRREVEDITPNEGTNLPNDGIKSIAELIESTTETIEVTTSYSETSSNSENDKSDESTDEPTEASESFELRPPKPPPSTTSTTTTTTYVPSTTLPPNEQLQHIMQGLEELLNNQEPVTIVEVGEKFDQVDTLLDTNEDLAIPGQLLHLLDQLGARADLNGSHTVTTVRNNIALVMADATPQEPIRGLRVAARDRDIFSAEAFEIIRDEVNATHVAATDTEAVVHLPLSVASSSRRISFVVFRDDRAFQSAGQHYTANSRVFSVNVENITTFDQGEVIDIYLRPKTEDIERNQSRACVFWRFLDDGTGEWSQDGCTLVPSTDSNLLDICRCEHLTHFAEILVSRTVFSERNESALEVLSIIGCIISVIGLCIIGLTAILFRSWRRDFINKIWLQLCMAVLVLVLCFLIVVFVKFENYNASCMIIGMLLHYSTLASFCWMLVAAILSYRRLVLVFNRDFSHKLLKASAFAWGAPCAVIAILLSIDPQAYAGQFEEMAPSASFCYPSGLAIWLTVYAPIAAMLLVNWILFVLIVRSVFASRRIQRHGDSNEALRCASVSFLLVFLFGLPWVFGLFAYNIVAAYLFTITATYQGVVLFIFFIVGNKKTRELWLNKLKIKQTRKVPVTSSTYTNKSSSGWRPGNGATPTEGNTSVPRSIASRDDSRFS